MMATEVQSGDLDSATSSRLEVSIDGLTLSPDPEGEQAPVEDPEPEPGPNANPAEPDGDTEAAAAGEDGEAGRPAMEKKWGFPLQELYGMGLRFFKGTVRRVRGRPTSEPSRASPAQSCLTGCVTVSC